MFNNEAARRSAAILVALATDMGLSHIVASPNGQVIANLGDVVYLFGLDTSTGAPIVLQRYAPNERIVMELAA